MIFSERLKELRRINNVTQKQVADILGIAERNYRRYEIVDIDIRISALLKLAKYFNVSTDYLLGLDNVPNRQNQNQ